jgi:hypothetical protein
VVLATTFNSKENTHKSWPTTHGKLATHDFSSMVLTKLMMLIYAEEINDATALRY